METLILPQKRATKLAMSIPRRSLLCALFLSPVVLAGCGTFSDVRYAPRRGVEGGFTVLTDGPDRPTSTQVAADIGAFAQTRGFARQAALPPPFVDPLTRGPVTRAPDRYLRGTLELEVSYQPATHRVSAFLHDSASNRERKPIRRFYQDFHREFAPRYGPHDPISESAFSSDQRTYDDDAPTSAPGLNDARSVGLGRGT